MTDTIIFNPNPTRTYLLPPFLRYLADLSLSLSLYLFDLKRKAHEREGCTQSSQGSRSLLRRLVLLAGTKGLMGDNMPSSPMGSRLPASADRDLLVPVLQDPEDPIKGGPSANSAHYSSREAFHAVLRSWASKKFMSGCVILLPIAITFYITWWFVKFVDGFFSPLYGHLGIHIFGLGFVTSIVFIFMVGIFFSSWMGASILSIGEWFIKRMPLVRHIYSASKQISAAISPDQNSRAFKEVAIIRHPRVGEYVFGFITSSLTLQTPTHEEELCSVYVPTNHLYLGDIFLINARDIIRPNLSVREGIEIVVSGGMTMPQVISPKEPRGTDRV